MSNERIDLTQEELREKLFEWMTKDYDDNQFIDITGEWEVIDEIMDGIEHLGLIAELKRCYEREDEVLHEFQKMCAQIDGLRDILSLLEDRHDIDMSQFKNYFASE